MAPCLYLVLCALAVAAPVVGAQTTPHFGSSSLPPRIRTDLVPGATVQPFQELRFRVSARDPDGARVSLQLLNPPSGMIFDPVVGGANPATVEARWSVPETLGGRITLVFEARDERGHVTRLERTLQVLAGFDATLLTGDLTGDGRPDLLATASQADLDGARDAGALYLWADASAPSGAPTARLVTGQAFDHLGSLGYAGGAATQLADVTGDGVDDVVTIGGQERPDGTLHVFAGGPSLLGEVAPSATLRAPGAMGLGDLYEAQGILILDLTGDGVLDIVAGSSAASPQGIPGAGALYVFEGGARLSGELDPSVILAVPGAKSSDQLGKCDGQSLLYGDVNGDGFLDLVVGAEGADLGGVTNAGAVYVWNGGGVPASAPSATLSVPSALAPMISQPLGQPLHLADVTGDGILDVLVGSSRADAGGVHDTGAIFVFTGGSGLAGALLPQAILAVPGATADDRLGADRADGFRLADVTGDGRLDVVAPSLDADFGGVSDRGAVYVFDVGNAAGEVAPLARLSVPGAQSGDRLGYAGGSGLACIDLSGDGVLDVVSQTTLATIDGVPRAGAIYLFVGGASLTGEVAPLASLSVPGASAQDMLGDRLVGSGLQFLDLTGDGTLEVITSSSKADVAGAVDAGAAYVFGGDGGYAGVMAPVATLLAPSPHAGDQFGVHGVSLADVTGDGKPDAVVSTPGADSGGVYDSGEIYVFPEVGAQQGVSTPSAALALPVGAILEHLFLWQLADVTGDGILDLCAATSADQRESEIVVFPGGPMTGTLGPSARFPTPKKQKTRPTLGPGPAHDQMYPALVLDLMHQGRLQLLCRSSNADVGGVHDTGALYLFSLTESGAPASSRLLHVPNARPGDQLGR